MRKRSENCFLFGKFADMFQHIADFTQNKPCFAHVAFKCALSQILFYCIVDFVFIFQNAGLQLFQSLYSVIYIEYSSGVEKFTLCFNDFSDFMFRHENSPSYCSDCCIN